MKYLLVAAAVLTPLLATAQVPYHLLIHAQRFVIHKPIHLFQCLADTLTARPLLLDSGRVVTLKAFVNDHWWVLNQFINYNSVDFYVRHDELVITPAPPSPPAVHRHKRHFFTIAPQ
jgi:hypothetical protein